MTWHNVRSRTPIFLIVLVGAALRFHQLDYKSMWVDEIGQVVIAQGGFLHALLAPREHVAAAPLDYIITWLALQVGQGEFILRFAPAMWSTLTIAVTYRLAHMLTRSFAVANIAALLLAISAAAVHYAQEVRFYALGTFLIGLGVCLFVQACSMPTVRNWLACACLFAIGFYAHYYALFVVALLLGFGGIVWVAGRIGWLPGAASDLIKKRPDRFLPPMVGLLTLGGIVAILALPWLLYAGRGAASFKPFGSLPLADLVLKPVWGGEGGANLGVWIVGGWLLVAAMVLGIAALARARSLWGLLLVLVVVGGVAAVIASDYVVSYPFAPRQLIFFEPYYLILAAVGFHALWRILPNQVLVRYAVGFVLVVGIGWVAWSGLSVYYNQPKDDWRSAARLIAGAIRQGDALVVTQPTLQTYLLYYAPGLGSYVNENPNPRRMWIVGWGGQSKQQAQSLVPAGWKAIALDAENGVNVLYTGPISENALWIEASAFPFTPQVLAYSDVLERTYMLDAQRGAQMAAQARAALAHPMPPLLDAQRTMLQEKLARIAP